MAGTNLGTAYVTIMPSTRGISGSISRALSGEAESAGTAAGGILGNNIGATLIKTLAGLGIGLAIKKFFTDSINLGGELQQNLGGTEAVFGQYAENIQKTAEDAYKNMGMSASDYMATANKMGSLFQGSGLDQQRSLELTTKAMQRASDVASVMGISQEMAMESIAGAAKGNFTMMDNLGVAMNATTLQAYALEKGVNFKWNTASNAEKAELAMQMFMERTAQYEGNFARESEETFSGSLGAMKAAAQNFMANLSLGRDIQQPLAELAASTRVFLTENLFPMIGNILKQLPGIIGQGLKWAFENIPSMVDSVISFLENLANNIEENSGVFKEKMMEMGHAAIEMLKNIDWAGLGSAIINLIWAGLQAIAPVLWEGIKWLAQQAKEWFLSIDWPQVGRDLIDLIKRGLEELGSLIWDGLKAIGEKAGEKLKEVDWEETGKELVRMVVNGIKFLAGLMWENAREIAIKTALKIKEIDWHGVGESIINFIVNGLKAIGHLVWGALKEIGTTAWNWLNNINWKGVGHNIIDFIVNGLKEFGEKIWTKLKELGKEAWEKVNGLNWDGLGHNIVSFIVSGIKEFGSDIVSALTWNLTDAWNTVANFGWSSLGSSISSGIASGIGDGGSGIVNNLVSWCSSAWENAKSFLRINSPSKLFARTIGEPISEGIAKGIDDKAQTITDSLLNVAKDSLTTIDTGFAYDATASALDSGTAAAGSISINVYPSAGMDERQLADLVQQRLTFEQRQRQAAWGTA